MKKHQRVLLKLSGEVLAGRHKEIIEREACQRVVVAIKGMRHAGIEVAIVIGGGNIFRGSQLKALGIPGSPSDQIGMLATLINGLALQQSLELAGCYARLMSALECPRAAESYNWSRAMEHLSHGHVVIFVGGTGNPYFTTDTAAAMRAAEIEATILLKATKVDGVYDKDPLKHANAQKFEKISYNEFLSRQLGVMDASSIALCQNQKIPIHVFNMQLLWQGNVQQLISKPFPGTLICE
jgi:uridylate kinase